MILWILAGIGLGVFFVTLLDEFRTGGVLNWRGASLSYDDNLAELLEFPLPDGWDEHALLRTYAEITSL